MSPCSVSRVRWSLPVCECGECVQVNVCVVHYYVRQVNTYAGNLRELMYIDTQPLSCTKPAEKT